MVELSSSRATVVRTHGGVDVDVAFGGYVQEKGKASIRWYEWLCWVSYCMTY